MVHMGTRLLSIVATSRTTTFEIYHPDLDLKSEQQRLRDQHTLKSTTDILASPPKMFDQYFNRLPTELQLLILHCALFHEVFNPRTISISIPLCLPTEIRTPALPPLFHVNTLFRREAMQTAEKKGLFIPLLSASRSANVGTNILPFTGDLDFVLVSIAVRLGSAMSKILRKRKPKVLHLFNPNTDLVSLDVSRQAFWLNAFLRISPVLRSQIRYLQLVVGKDRPYSGPMWTLSMYQWELDLLPGLMPNLKLVIAKREDFALGEGEIRDYARREWLKERDCKELGVKFMRVREGRLEMGKEESDGAMVEYHEKWVEWLGDEAGPGGE